MGAAAKKKEEDTSAFWKPVRRGPIYCAPKCGFNCTYKAFRVATHRAHLLCVELGPLWKPRVHENMGWHADAMGLEGYAQVCINTDGGNIEGRSRIRGYMAFINQRGDGWSGGTWTASGKTGTEALRLARKEFDEHFRLQCKINEVLRRGMI